MIINVFFTIAATELQLVVNDGGVGMATSWSIDPPAVMRETTAPQAMIIATAVPGEKK